MLQIMVVDDMDIAVRELKRLKLWGEESGFVITDVARNGCEALEKLEKSQVDLVLTDIKMPKIDGIELLKKITEKRLCDCVVLLSDHSEFSFARQGIVLGAFDYIVKPVDEEVLNKLLQRVKEHILNKRYEQNRVKQLEEKLVEKVEVFFPQSEVNQLVEALLAGDVQTAAYAAAIVDIVYTNLNHELIKVQTLLRSIMLEIAASTSDTFNWLDKFVSRSQMSLLDFNSADRPELVKDEFIAAIDRIAKLIERLKYTTRENGIVNQVCKFVLENIDEDLSLNTVSKALFMNKSYISETFKQRTGMSFVEYLTAVKVERAKKMLSDGGLKTYEVAELLGFKDIEYFSRLFKKHTGSSPTEYRQNGIKKV